MKNFVLKSVIAAALFLVYLGCETEPSVSPPPPGAVAPTIGSFQATPSRITSDQATTLTWLITGAQKVNINQGIGVVTGDSITPSALIQESARLTH